MHLYIHMHLYICIDIYSTWWSAWWWWLLVSLVYVSRCQLTAPGRECSSKQCSLECICLHREFVAPLHLWVCREKGEVHIS